jgi:hypothetical protein
MATGAPNFLPFLFVVPIVIWRMYSRIKRNIAAGSTCRNGGPG